MPDPSPSTLTSKLQLLVARKKEWWPATADSLPPGGYLSNCETHCLSAGIADALPVLDHQDYRATRR